MTARHVLVVDDNAGNLAVLGRLLSLQGLTYTPFSDPTRFLDALPSLPDFQVAFIDLEMPHVDGYRVLESLRSDPRFAKTHVVAYTVHHLEVNNAREKGFDSFLAKPVDMDEFPDYLQKILNGEDVWKY
jgi:CheY-like chemotaxis protein